MESFVLGEEGLWGEEREVYSFVLGEERPEFRPNYS